MNPSSFFTKNKNDTNGYLYIMYNSVFKQYGENVYKLGRTNNLKNRMTSGYTTSYIEPSEYLYTTRLFTNCIQAERILFFLLRKNRIRDKREFFKVDLQVIKDTILSIEQLTDTQMTNVYKRIINQICPDNIIDKLNDEDYNNILNFDNSNIDLLLEKFRYRPKVIRDYHLPYLSLLFPEKNELNKLKISSISADFSNLINETNESFENLKIEN
jgi:hypothetical protein